MKMKTEDCYLLPHAERGIVWGYSVRKWFPDIECELSKACSR